MIATVCGVFCVSVPCAGDVVPEQITRGPGDDTEAAWSPDGTHVAFQREVDGSVDLYVLDLTRGAVSPLVTGPGHACHPAWSPDGRWILYSLAHFTKTAALGIENGYNLFVIAATGGELRRLTEGLVRDYTPTFSPDGETVYFSSTRGLTNGGAGLYRVPFAGGEPEPVVMPDAAEMAYVQPDVSPDGRLVCCGFIQGIRSNWALRLLRLKTDLAEYPLTDPDFPMYGTRWSPDGEWIACTGYRPGDPGWGVYLVEVRTARCLRLDTGEGNARSPIWSPDGEELIFESNPSGSYKLFRVPLPDIDLASAESVEQPEPVLRFAFDGVAGSRIADESGNGNDGHATGAFNLQGDGALFSEGRCVTVPRPRGLDFGEGAFAARVVVEVEEHTDALRLAIVGDYPDNHLGWQIFLNDGNYAYFNSRTPDGKFVGARSDEPLATGRKVTLIGVRGASGKVELYVNGLRQRQTGSGATMAYGNPTQVRVGSQYDGSAPFIGTIHEVEVWAGELGRAQLRGDSLERFLADE